jgi:hypothetical protein
MSQIKLAPNASGSGIFTLESPNSNTNRTLTLPDNAGTFITTGSSGQSIPKAALPTGSVLQVVTNTASTATTTTSTSYTTVISCSITPTSSSSKILLLGYCDYWISGGPGNEQGCDVQVQRGSTVIVAGGNGANIYGATIAFIGGKYSPIYLDSPATTSSTTYNIQLKVQQSGVSVIFNRQSALSSLTLMEIAA